jgi:hypothetical protein
MSERRDAPRAARTSDGDIAQARRMVALLVDGLRHGTSAVAESVSVE